MDKNTPSLEWLRAKVCELKELLDNPKPESKYWRQDYRRLMSDIDFYWVDLLEDVQFYGKCSDLNISFVKVSWPSDSSMDLEKV